MCNRPVYKVIKCSIIYTSKRLERKCLSAGTVPIFYNTSIQLNLTVVKKKILRIDMGQSQKQPCKVKKAS